MPVPEAVFHLECGDDDAGTFSHDMNDDRYWTFKGSVRHRHIAGGVAAVLVAVSSNAKGAPGKCAIKVDGVATNLTAQQRRKWLVLLSSNITAIPIAVAAGLWRRMHCASNGRCVNSVQEAISDRRLPSALVSGCCPPPTFDVARTGVFYEHACGRRVARSSCLPA
jgi:hypothetical protein